ncbi:hypothetical protein NMG60_11034826 [Bertholletia excelsa]
MRSTLGRNLNLCFAKVKLPGTSESSSPIPEDQGRHPFLMKNFNSLYDVAFDSTPNTKSLPSSSGSSESGSGSDVGDNTPDFATAVASQRFFFSSPGHSNSIIDSSSSPPSPADPQQDSLVSGGVAVPTYSPDPYQDFRRSMQEMVEARDLVDVRANWDYLHELLACYLALNPKSTHKFIVGAFADLLVSLMPSQPSKVGDFPKSGFPGSVSRRCM